MLKPIIHSAIKVEFSIADYVRTHGKAPRGYGAWAFQIERDSEERIFWAPPSTYGVARAWMRAQVEALCLPGDEVVVTVCT